MYRFILFYFVLYICIYVAPWSCETRHLVPLYVHTCSGMTIKLNLTWTWLEMLLIMFLFQKWLGSPFPEDVWAWWLLMHWLQLQFTPCEALLSVWICFAWQYYQAHGHRCCLCTFSYPISSFQSTLHLICFDTALLEQPPLSVMTLCDLPCLWRVSVIVF